MKHLFYFIIFCLIIASCTKNKDNPAPSSSNSKNNLSSSLLDSILKKWDVSSTSSTRITSSNMGQYKSFEFTKDSLYIITTVTDSIISGRFSLNSIDSVVTLANYGVLHILQVSSTYIQFTLVLNSKPTSVVSVAAAPAPPVVTSTGDTTTNKITRSWKLIKETVNGTENPQVTTALANGTAYAHVTFTEYSTYFTEVYDGTSPTATKANGVWQWAAPGVQNRICIADSLPITCSNNASVAFDPSGNLVVTKQSPIGVTPATVTIDTYQGY